MYKRHHRQLSMAIPVDRGQFCEPRKNSYHHSAHFCREVLMGSDLKADSHFTV